MSQSRNVKVQSSLNKMLKKIIKKILIFWHDHLKVHAAQPSFLKGKHTPTPMTDHKNLQKDG